MNIVDSITYDKKSVQGNLRITKFQKSLEVFLRKSEKKVFFLRKTNDRFFLIE